MTTNLSIFTIAALLHTNSYAQVIAEEDFIKSGDKYVARVDCNSDALFQISLSKPIQKYVHTAINLAPLKEYIVDFELIGAPENMFIEAKNGSKIIHYTPLTDFEANTDLVVFIVPKSDQSVDDSVNLNCRSYKVNLPLKRDMPPKVKVKNQIVYIPISGDQTAREYSLIYNQITEASDLNVFENDDNEDLTYIWVEARDDKIPRDIDDGILKFKHNGPAPLENNSFTIRLKAVDHLKQESEEASIEFKLIPNSNSRPIWSLVDENGNIRLNGTILEGQEEIVKPFIAKDSGSGKTCSIRPQNVIPGKFDLSNDILRWTPSFDVVNDSQGDNEVEIKLTFVAETESRVEEEATVIFKVKNSTKPDDQKKFDLAIENFRSAEAEFLNIVEEPLCYLRYASEIVLTREDQISGLKSATSKFEGGLAVGTLTNPVALGITQGLGILLETLSSANGANADRISAKVESLTSEIADYKSKSTECIKLLNSLKEFKTAEECNSLLKASAEVSNEVQKLRLRISNYTVISAIFNRKNEQRIQNACGLRYRQVVAAQN